MKWAKIAALLVMLGWLFAGIAASQATQAQGDRLVWSPVLGAPTATDIQDVVMVDQDTAWAVGVEGDAGRIFKLETQNGQWRIVLNQGFTSSLRAVDPVNKDEVWAVGGNRDGLIVHRGPAGWEYVANPAPASDLFTIQMFGDGREGWAGGFEVPDPQSSNYPLLLHYTNGRWERDPSIGRANGMFGLITSLHFAGNTGWAVGPGIWKYSNGEWRQESRCAPGDNSPDCFGAFYGVRAISNDEAWVVGIAAGPCPPCNPAPRADHRVNGSWQSVLPSQPLLNSPGVPFYFPNLETVAFFDADHGLAVGSYTLHQQFSEADLRPLLVSYTGGQWSYVNLPVQTGDLNGVSMADSTHALAVGNDGLILSYGYGTQNSVYITPRPSPPVPTATPTASGGTASPTPTLPGGDLTPTVNPTLIVPNPEPTPSNNPATAVDDPHLPDVTYFPLVGHTLRGEFKRYWLEHGGLAQFGYPITEEFSEINSTDGKTYVVQYFERNRFEHHPENRPPYNVLLGLLGRTITRGREREVPFQASSQRTEPGYIYFTETMHNIDPHFTDYWLSHGGLPVYGYPISEAFVETSPTDGKPYLVQYFERNRLEYHPELPQAFRVSLGLLGVDEIKERGWIT